MSNILRLRGRNALSAFRASKLSRSFSTAVPRVTAVRAEFWHFVQAERALSQAETQRLERILTYGPLDTAGAASGELLLAVPRIGTISPWSSKATDIARHFGRREPGAFHQRRRIRGRSGFDGTHIRGQVNGRAVSGVYRHK